METEFFVRPVAAAVDGGLSLYFVGFACLLQARARNTFIQVGIVHGARDNRASPSYDMRVNAYDTREC